MNATATLEAATANAFAPAFLARLAAGARSEITGRSRVPHCWSLVKLAPAHYGLLGPGEPVPQAVFHSRDLAQLAAAALPGASSRHRYELSSQPEGWGHLLRRSSKSGDQLLGVVRQYWSGYAKAFCLAEELAASPFRLAQLLEAAGEEALRRAGQILVERVAGAVAELSVEATPDRAPVEVLHPRFLRDLARLDGSPTSLAAELDGPWQVLPVPAGRYGASQVGDSEPAAHFETRAHALLAAAIFPGLGHDDSFVLGSAAALSGLDFPIVPLREVGEEEILGWLREPDPATLDLLHTANSLVRVPASLAFLLEAAGGRRLAQAGEILARAVLERDGGQELAESMAHLLAQPAARTAAISQAFTTAARVAPGTHPERSGEGSAGS